MDRRFTVRNVRMGTGEIIPVLSDRTTGLPPILPMRWIVRRRRLAVAVNTMKNDLFGISDLYEWAHADKTEITPSPHEFFRSGGRLSPRQLMSLMDYVRGRKYRRGKTARRRSIDTAALHIASIEMFLKWAADPYSRGSEPYIPPDELRAYYGRLEATFRPLRTASGGSKRPEPLTQKQDEFLRGVISPVRDQSGKLLYPLPGQSHLHSEMLKDSFEIVGVPPGA